MVKRYLICLLLIFLIAPAPTSAQNMGKNQPATKLEQFLSKRGKLIVKDSQEAGTLNGQYGSEVTVDALTIYEPGKEVDKLRGLRVEVKGGGRLERSDTSFLDIDEVESLSQAIAYMMDLLDKWKATNREYTEVIFSTKGNFKLGFYQKGSKLQAFSQDRSLGVGPS